jgi:hypothetical protein
MLGDIIEAVTDEIRPILQLAHHLDQLASFKALLTPTAYSGIPTYTPTRWYSI